MKRLNKIISTVVLACFLVNTAMSDYAFALSTMPGSTQAPTREGMYALAQKLFAAKRGPGAIDFDMYLPTTFTGLASEIPGVKVVPADYNKPPIAWKNNPILQKTDLIKAFEHFRDNEAWIFSKELAIKEGYWELEKEKEGELPIARIEEYSDGTYGLVIHTKFVQMWNDIRKNDIWFEYTFQDGKTRTVSLAWALFYRIAKHEMADIRDSSGEYKGGGHILHVEDPMALQLETATQAQENENIANEIGGRYKILNDALWMWFLGSYCFGNVTRYNNDILKERLEWFFDPASEEDESLDLKSEFPNLLANNEAKQFAIQFALLVNQGYFSRPDTRVAAPIVEHKFIDDYNERKRYIVEVIPTTGASDSAADDFNQRTVREYQDAYRPFMVGAEDLGLTKSAVIFPALDPDHAGRFINIGMKVPEAPTGGLVVAPESSYFCGTDVDKMSGKRPVDLGTYGVLGHEAVGRVVKVGSGVSGYKVGDRILINPNIDHGEVRIAHSHAVPGFFAPYVIMIKTALEAGNAVKVSDSTPSKYLALSEPLACALYDLTSIRKNLSGEGTKLVIHGAGFQGIMHAVLASRLKEVRFRDIIIFDKDASRVTLARKVLDNAGLYNVQVIDSSKLDSKEMDTLCENTDATVIAFSPANAKDAEDVYISAGARTRKDGVVSVYGGSASGKDWLSISVRKVHSDQIKYVGNSGAPLETLKEAHRLIEENDAISHTILDLFITHEFTLSQLADALKVAHSGEALKVRVVCSEDAGRGSSLSPEEKVSRLMVREKAKGQSPSLISVREGAKVYYMTPSDETVNVIDLDKIASVTNPGVRMHLMVYRELPQFTVIIQARPELVEGLMAEGKTLPPLNPDTVALLGKEVPLLAVSEEDKPSAITDAFRSGKTTVLVKGWGVIAAGFKADEACFFSELATNTAGVYRAAEAMGDGAEVRCLTPQQADALGAVEAARLKVMRGDPSAQTAIQTKKVNYSIDMDEIATLRTELIRISREIARRGMVVGPGGNISVCTKDRKIMLIKASGRSFESMKPEDYIGVDIESGNVIDGLGGLKPSVEMLTHRACYLKRSDIRAVVHAHPLYATGIATAEKTYAMYGVELPRIGYVHPGGQDLADAISEKIVSSDMVLMTNHGALSVGRDLSSALKLTIELEETAEMIVTNRQIFNERLTAYNTERKVLDSTPAAKILDVKNRINSAREALWMESEAVRPHSAESLKDGDITCDLTTKEIIRFKSALPDSRDALGKDVVVLRPLSLTASQKRHRDELVKKLRSDDRDTEGRKTAIATLRAMVARGILPKPIDTADVFQHCHSTYSHSPGNTPAYIAWKGFVLGLQVTGIVDHDTLAGIKEFRDCAKIVGLRNPTSGYEQRVISEGTPFEFMQTNSPGNIGETYVAFHGVSRPYHKIQEERVVPAKIVRFKKNADHINGLGIIPMKLNYEEHIAPLTEAGNPTEKHLAEAIARLIYKSYADNIRNGDYSQAIDCANRIIKACGGKLIAGEEIEKAKDLNALTFMMRNKVVTVLKSTKELQPTRAELVNDKELYDDAHKNNELVYYCYLGGGKCEAENYTDIMSVERKLDFIRTMEGSLDKAVIDWWLAKENATMLHLWFRYQKSIGANGIAFMPNRNSPEEIEKVIAIARECGFDHIANGMDVNTPDMPYTYYAYSCRPEFIKETLYIVSHENKMRASEIYDPSFGNRLAESYRAVYEKEMVSEGEASGRSDVDAFPVAIPEKLAERKRLRVAGDNTGATAVDVFKKIFMRRPKAPEGGLIIEIEACYICGTDTNHFLGERTLDSNTLGILGHEAVGKVVDIGKGVEGYKIGERVLLNTISSDMTCHVCKQGIPHECQQKKARSHQYPGFLTHYAIFTKEDVRTGNVIKIRQNVPPRYGALAESIACSLHDLMNIKRASSGESKKLVIWGTGFQGIMHAALAALVDDVKYDEIILLGRNDKKNDEATAMFTRLGLQDKVKVYNNENLPKDKLERLCGGADASVVAFSPPSPDEKPGVAAAMYAQAVALTRRGGVFSLYGGLPKDWPLLSSWPVHYREIKYIGNSGAPASVLARSHALIEQGILTRGLLDSLITHEYTLGELDKALEASAGREALKVLVRCNRSLIDIIEVGGLKLRVESGVSEVSDSPITDFESTFYYTLEFYDGQRRVAAATVAVNDKAILLPACTHLHVEPDLRNRGLGTELIQRAFAGAAREATRRSLSPKWALFSEMMTRYEDRADAESRLKPMDAIMKHAGAEQYSWGYVSEQSERIEKDAGLKDVLTRISPVPAEDEGVFVFFARLDRVTGVTTNKESAASTGLRSTQSKQAAQKKVVPTIRRYEPGEAAASVGRLEGLVSAFLRSVGIESGISIVADTEDQSPVGFRKPAESDSMADVWIVNPNGLDRDAFLAMVAEVLQLKVAEGEQDYESWKRLKDQVWLDGKLELAVLDVPWIQKTDIRVNDLYNPSVHLLVGLGDVRGSASYESFYVNYYRNNHLKEVQNIFARAGYRMIPIPVQMEKEDLPDMPRISQSILRDSRIIRIALTKPTKVAAVDTGLFEALDPDTLPTGAVNTAAIEGTGSSRHFVRRTTDGLGTVAKIKEDLTKTERSLGKSIVGMIGLGGFGLAVLGKLLTDQDAPKEIRIAVRDKSYEKAVEALSSIRKAYTDKFGKDPQTKVRIYKYSELDHAQRQHPFQNADALVDCTDVGQNDNDSSLAYLDFFHPGMVVLHAAYRDANKRPRVPPILIEAKNRGAIVHNGIADWLGHQYMQIIEDLKRAAGLTPTMPAWNNDPKWDTIRGQLEEVAFRWANAQGLKDAEELLNTEMTAQASDVTATQRAARQSQSGLHPLITVIDEFTAPVAYEKGPGVVKMAESELENIYKSINLLHQDRIEIFVHKGIGLSETMKKAIIDINLNRKKADKDAEDVVICRPPYENEEHLAKMLSVAPQPGVKRIVVTAKGLCDAEKLLAMKDSFKDTRLLNVALPDNYSEMKPGDKTFYQAWMLKVAILGRMVERDSGISLRTALVNMLEGSIEGDVNEFIDNLAKPESEWKSPGERIGWFLGKMVRLSRKIAEEYELLKLRMKAFWTAA